MTAYRSIRALALWIGAPLAAGLLGALATATSVETWYVTLAKPAWTPPNWLFGPMWTALYVAMGVAAWRVWRREAAAGRRGALLLFWTQLALNAAWSPLFFGWRAPGPALIVILLLWASIAATLAAFRRIDAPAAWLLVPYLAWVGYAAALNWAIWRLNGG